MNSKRINSIWSTKHESIICQTSHAWSQHLITKAWEVTLKTTLCELIGHWLLHLLLTANDCFEIGRLAYQREDFYHTAMWMQASLEKEEEEKNKTIPRELVLDYLSYAALMVRWSSCTQGISFQKFKIPVSTKPIKPYSLSLSLFK